MVLPQCPQRHFWTDTDMLQMAMAALAQEEREFHTDPDRTYLMGLSLGGDGAWELAKGYPKKWAAIAIALLTAAESNPAGPDRILLVVDDLDRCSPSEVIDIAESLKLLLEDDDQMSLYLQRFLAEHQVPYALPLYDAMGRYQFASPEKIDVLASALLRTIGKGHDNELFVLLADLLELDDALDPLLKAVRVAVSRHHQVIVVVPWPSGMRPPSSPPPPPHPPARARPHTCS